MNISVIVVTYNSRAYIRRCIESILGQLGRDDELIVVDCGSTDGTPEVAESYGLAQVIRTTNRGYAGGNNLGAAAAQGAYLVFLNPDTHLRPGALAALVAPLRGDGPDALSTACVVHMRQPSVVNACGNTLHIAGLAYCRGANQQAALYRASAEVDAVSGAAFGVRRAVFEQLGGFDEQFFMYVEDTDLSWRARLAGYRVRYAADAVVEHDYRVSYSPRKAFYLDRNRHIMLLKNLGRRAYLRLLPALLAAEVITWGYMLMQGPRFWLVKPQVYAALLAERRSIRARRRAAQALRRAPDGVVMAGFAVHLEFQQLAGAAISRAAAVVFDPFFSAARRMAIGGGR